MPRIANRWNLPHLGLGLGLRGEHIADILRDQPDVDWFEIITENFLVHRGFLSWALDAIRERYPVVMHGVSLSIGSTDPLDIAYLRQVKALADRIGAPWISDHVCWTGVGGRNSHDLLPVPYNDEMLRWMADRANRVMDVLERPLMLENPSSYVEFASSDMDEASFIVRLCEEADCGLLLDVNNIYVSAENHGFSASAYLGRVPWDRVVQFHVAGHTNLGTHILDSHIGPVIDPVWELLADASERCGGRATMLEWDDEIPDFATTWTEACKARAFLQHRAPEEASHEVQRRASPLDRADPPAPPAATDALMRWMHAVVAADDDADRAAIPQHILANDRNAPEGRIDVYTEAIGARFVESMAEDFPSIEAAMGPARFWEEVAAYLREHPSTGPWLEHLGDRFAAWLKDRDVPAWCSDAAEVHLALIRAGLAPCFTPVGPEDIAAIPADQQAEAVFEFAPVVSLVTCQHKVHDLLGGEWRDVPGDGSHWPEVTRSVQHIVVSRPSFQVHSREVSAHEAGMLRNLMAGAGLQDAVVRYLEEVDDADAAAQAVMTELGQWTATWTELQMITAVTVQ